MTNFFSSIQHDDSSSIVSEKGAVGTAVSVPENNSETSGVKSQTKNSSERLPTIEERDVSSMHDPRSEVKKEYKVGPFVGTATAKERDGECILVLLAVYGVLTLENTPCFGSKELIDQEAVPIRTTCCCVVYDEDAYLARIQVGNGRTGISMVGFFFGIHSTPP